MSVAPDGVTTPFDQDEVQTVVLPDGGTATITVLPVPLDLAAVAADAGINFGRIETWLDPEGAGVALRIVLGRDDVAAELSPDRVRARRRLDTAAVNYVLWRQGRAMARLRREEDQ